MEADLSHWKVEKFYIEDIKILNVLINIFIIDEWFVSSVAQSFNLSERWKR